MFFSNLTVPLRKKEFLFKNLLVGLYEKYEGSRRVNYFGLNIAFTFFCQNPVLFVISH